MSSFSSELREEGDDRQLSEVENKVESLEDCSANIDIHDPKSEDCRDNTEECQEPSTSPGLKTNPPISEKLSESFGLSDDESSAYPETSTSEGSDDDSPLRVMPYVLKYGRMEECQDRVALGPNGTTIPAKAFSELQWSPLRKIAFDLLKLVFGRDTLATHSLSGRKWPPFRSYDNRDKKQLDPRKIEDIIHAVKSLGGYLEPYIRGSMTLLCIEAAARKKRQKKRVLVVGGKVMKF